MTSPYPRKGSGYALIAATIGALLLTGLTVPLVRTTPDSLAEVRDGAESSPEALGAAPSPEAGVAVTAAATATLAPSPVTDGSPAAAGDEPAVPVPSTGPVPAEPESAPTTPAPGPTLRAPLTASDQGVTPTTIKVGAVLLDLRAATAVGLGLENYELETQRRIFDTHVDRLNASGVLGGRKVVLVFATYDPISSSGENSGPAICRRLAKDEKVFAVIGLTYTAGACAAVQYRIPVITSFADLESVYAASDNYMITSLPSYERIGRNWSAYLLDSGLSKGKKVGLLNVKDGALEELSADAAQATLSQLGQPLTYRAQLTNDQASAQSQIPVEVQRMKSLGVQQVMLPTNFLTAITFMQQAEQQGWYPTYLTSNIGALASNGLIRKGPARSLDNVIGVSSSTGISPEGRTEPPDDKDCRETYNRINPQSKQFAYGEDGPYGLICMVVRLFGAIAGPTGPDLTRRGFVATVQTLGPGTLATSLPGTFGPNKTNFAQNVMPARYSSACQCYRVAGPVAKTRY